MIANRPVMPHVTGSAARRRSRAGEPRVASLALAPPARPASRDANMLDWSSCPAAGWSEFRTHRAIFLASLTLQAASTRPERPGADSPVREGLAAG